MIAPLSQCSSSYQPLVSCFPSITCKRHCWCSIFCPEKFIHWGWFGTYVKIVLLWKTNYWIWKFVLNYSMFTTRNVQFLECRLHQFILRYGLPNNLFRISSSTNIRVWIFFILYRVTLITRAKFKFPKDWKQSLTLFPKWKLSGLDSGNLAANWQVAISIKVLFFN